MLTILSFFSSGCGPKINEDKSYFMIILRTLMDEIDRIKGIINYIHKHFLITYLGYHLYIRKTLISSLTDMVFKIIKGTTRWTKISSPLGMSNIN